MSDELRETLRGMVDRAAHHETANQVAPVMRAVERLDGDLGILTDSHKALQGRVGRLERVIFGDDTEKADGLVKQVSALTKAIGELNDQLQSWKDFTRGARWALVLLGALGVLGAVPGAQAILKLFGVVP